MGIGIMNLTPSDSTAKPAKPLDSAFANTACDGVAVRTQWSRVQPTKGTNFTAYLDSAKTLSASTGKKWSAIITAGVTTPQWVYDAGAQSFNVTEQSGAVSKMPLPWDKVFQNKWSAFLGFFFGRYGKCPDLTYVVISGFGRRAESFFVTTAEDMAAMDALGGLTKWIEAAKWIIDQYGRLCRVPFVLDLGAPYPTDAGTAALQEVCDYAGSKYHLLWVKSDGLAPHGPPVGSIGVTELQKLGRGGYQFGLPMEHDVQGMTDSLNRGIGFGAKFIEVYQGDCDYAPHRPALLAASVQMKNA